MNGFTKVVGGVVVGMGLTVAGWMGAQAQSATTVYLPVVTSSIIGHDLPTTPITPTISYTSTGELAALQVAHLLDCVLAARDEGFNDVCLDVGLGDEDGAPRQRLQRIIDALYGGQENPGLRHGLAVTRYGIDDEFEFVRGDNGRWEILPMNAFDVENLWQQIERGAFEHDCDPEYASHQSIQDTLKLILFINVTGCTTVFDSSR